MTRFSSTVILLVALGVLFNSVAAIYYQFSWHDKGVYGMDEGYGLSQDPIHILSTTTELHFTINTHETPRILGDVYARDNLENELKIKIFLYHWVYPQVIKVNPAFYEMTHRHLDPKDHTVIHIIIKLKPEMRQDYDQYGTEILFGLDYEPGTRYHRAEGIAPARLASSVWAQVEQEPKPPTWSEYFRGYLPGTSS